MPEDTRIATAEEAALLDRAIAVVTEIEELSTALGLTTEETEAEDWSHLFHGIEVTHHADGVKAGEPVVDPEAFNQTREALEGAKTDMDRWADAARLFGALAGGVMKGAT